MRDDRKDIFSEKVIAGRRTYFLDVRENRDGDKYLIITESKQAGSGHQHDKVMVFEENLEAFYESLGKVVEFIRESRQL